MSTPALPTTPSTGLQPPPQGILKNRTDAQNKNYMQEAADDSGYETDEEEVEKKNKTTVKKSKGKVEDKSQGDPSNDAVLKAWLENAQGSKGQTDVAPEVVDTAQVDEAIGVVDPQEAAGQRRRLRDQAVRGKAKVKAYSSGYGEDDVTSEVGSDAGDGASFEQPSEQISDLVSIMVKSVVTFATALTKMVVAGVKAAAETAKAAYDSREEEVDVVSEDEVEEAKKDDGKKVTSTEVRRAFRNAREDQEDPGKKAGKVDLEPFGSSLPPVSPVVTEVGGDQEPASFKMDGTKETDTPLLTSSLAKKARSSLTSQQPSAKSVGFADQNDKVSFEENDPVTTIGGRDSGATTTNPASSTQANVGTTNSA